MEKQILAAGLIAVCCGASPGANAQTCPQGQIYRVSMNVCQPKSPQNAHWLKQGNATTMLKPSAAKPAVGDLVLFGATVPTLLKPSGWKPVAKLPAPKHALIKARVSKAAATKGRAPRRDLPAVAGGPAARPSFEEAKVGAARKPAESAPELAVAPPLNASPTVIAEAPVERGSGPVNGPALTALEPQPEAEAEPSLAVAPNLSLKELAAASETSQAGAGDDATVPSPDQQIVARTGRDVRLPSNERTLTPPQAVEEPVSTHTVPPASTGRPVQSSNSTPAVESAKQVRIIPLYRRPEPRAPAAATSDLPDWGDEKKLIEALRADWKATPVTRTFRRGDEVPDGIPLQPLPGPFSGRHAGVNMHYLMSNDDAVLVLPGLRIVVDVYHSSTASLH